MEESDSGQQPKRCPCGFWGSPQTSGLCSKCYKAVAQEKTQDTLDAKAELMRDRQSAYSSHDSIGATSSSYLSTSCSQSSASDVEKAGQLLRQAVRNSNSNQSVELSNKSNAELSNKSNTELSNKSNAELNNKSNATNTETSSNSGSSNPSEDWEKSVSSSSTSKTASVVAVVEEVSENSVDNSVVANKPKSQQKDEATPEPGPCPSTPDKRGLKRDSSVLDEDTPDSTPEKPGTKSKKRCQVCKCKLELAQRTIGRCRCDSVFCSLHRLPELHDCDFDHKEDGRREAREKMVKPTRHLGTSFKRLGSDS